MSLPLALTQGTVIGGNYVIGTLINSGGFGAVYRAVDTSEGNRLCAIKETYDVTPAARRRALMEASVLLTIRNSHLPEVYDAFEEGGRFYLVMQLIEGQDLLHLLKARVTERNLGSLGEQRPQTTMRGPCDEQEVLSWLLPIIDVLQELHGRTPPVIHRDIKPANIILTPQQTAVLVDFGLTKLYQPDSNTQTLFRAVSEGFSPLEQYTSGTGPRSDIYSLAATMYLLLTNRLPQPAIQRSVHDELIAPRLLNPSLSSRVEQALLRALALDVDKRYQTMRDFAAALRGQPSVVPTTQPIVGQPSNNTHGQVFTEYDDITIAEPAHTPLLTTPGPDARTIYNPPSQGQRQTIQPVQPAQPPIQAAQVLSPAQQKAQKGQRGKAVQAAFPPTIPATPSNRGQAGQGRQVRPTPSSGGQTPYYSASPPSAVPGGGYGVTYQTKMHGPLPSSFGQGCLFGLIQAILAAVLVLFLRKEVFFYLAIFIGCIFYVIAGLTTTWRGGSFWRGGWSGFWAGVTSTVMFWVVLGIGLLIALVERMYADNMFAQQHGITLPQNEIARAWRAILPPLPTHVTAPTANPATNIFILLGIGLLLAILLGCLGGYFGASLYRTHVVARRRP